MKGSTSTAASSSASTAARRPPVGIVLCAGHGSRLRPATHYTPKPAVPFMGLPIAGYALRALARAGVEEIAANTCHLPEVMKSALEGACPEGVALTILQETELLGTGGGLRALWKRLGRDRSVVLYHGDVLMGIDLAPIIAAHEASGATATLVLRTRDPGDPLKNIFTDESGEVSGLFEHRRPGVVGEEREHSFTGIHILSPEVFEHLPEEGFCCLVTEVYPVLLKAGRLLGAHLTTAFHADLGTYERFLDAQSKVFESRGRLRLLSWSEEARLGISLGPAVVIEAGAVLRAPVRLEGPVLVRSGAVVGPEVSIQGEIEICEGRRVVRSSLWGKGSLREDLEGVLLPLRETPRGDEL